MLAHVEAREAVHVLLLRRLADAVPESALVLKGGVNLRMFFGSKRYSEDCDLDLEGSAREAYVSTVHDTLRGAWLRSRLAALGVERVEYSGRPAKNTDTTIRFKLGVVSHGGVRLPTRLEASLRGGERADESVRERVAADIAAQYLAPADGALELRHYPRPVAMRQKLRALAGRALPQARDVFDLWVLGGGDLSLVDVAAVRRGLATAELEEAGRRAWEMGYDQFRGQVVEFLADDDQRALDSPQEWEGRQLFVAELIDALLRAMA